MSAPMLVKSFGSWVISVTTSKGVFEPGLKVSAKLIKSFKALRPMKGKENDVIESAEECPGECIMIEPDWNPN